MRVVLFQIFQQQIQSLEESSVWLVRLLVCWCVIEGMWIVHYKYWNPFRTQIALLIRRAKFRNIMKNRLVHILFLPLFTLQCEVSMLNLSILMDVKNFYTEYMK
jgi:hypothetical protein